MIEYFKALLEWLKAPWRVAALVILIPVLVVAWLVYSESALVDEYLRDIVSDAEIDREAFDAVAAELLEDADLATLFEIDLGRNDELVLRSVTSSGEQSDVGIEIPFLSEGDDIGSIVGALQDRTVCVDYTEGPPANRFAEWMVRNGYAMTCGHKIPLGTETIIGAIAVSWKERPLERDRLVAEIELQRAAERLTK